MTENYNQVFEASLKQLAAAGLAAGMIGSTPIASQGASRVQPSSVQAKAPRGIRNNNPGNIEAGGSKWEGATGSDGRFLQFAEMEWGVRALMRTLMTYYKKYDIDTVRGIISRWAPPNENNTERYIRNVCAWTGFKPDQKLNLQNVKTLKSLAHAIARQETSHQLDAATLDKAISIMFKTYTPPNG